MLMHSLENSQTAAVFVFSNQLPKVFTENDIIIIKRRILSQNLLFWVIGNKNNLSEISTGYYLKCLICIIP